MSLLIVENLGKAYTDEHLFKDVNFTIEPGQKVALIAPNGAGKTTLFRILLGQEELFDGAYTYAPDIKVAYLSQRIDLEGHDNLWDYLHGSDSDAMQTYVEYWDTHDKGETVSNELKDKMDTLELWSYKGKIQDMINHFKLPDIPLQYYSGGQQKRLMLLRMMIDEPDLVFLDEPTNHLDHDMLEYLENYLKQKSIAVFLVSHDRYFIDRVVDVVHEIDKQKWFSYKGNYSYFVEQKAERIKSSNNEIERARSLLKKEQEWMSRGPRARGTKSKFRIERYDELKEKSKKKIEQTLEFEADIQRIGGHIVELKNMSFGYENLPIVNDFNYRFQKGEKIGIVGPNGVGKTSFLKVLLKELAPHAGKVMHGKTISFGYFRQHIEDFDEDKKVIDVVRDHGEDFLLSGPKRIPLAKLLEQFMFPPRLQHQPVSVLSGGQKKRLTLLTLLVQNPNFLILDEPTNDLDIMTLQAMEDFLQSYGGCILTVSHDRYFMDKVVDSLFVFEGEGVISHFNGSYTDYRYKEMDEKAAVIKSEAPKKKSGKEIREMTKKRDKLMRELEKLEARKVEIFNEFSQPLGSTQMDILQKELTEVMAKIEEKEATWMLLADSLE